MTPQEWLNLDLGAGRALLQAVKKGPETKVQSLLSGLCITAWLHGLVLDLLT